MPPNSISMNSNQPFYQHSNTLVTRVRLRGSWTTGNHQEVMVTLTGGLLVRISRNNGTDTFQIGAAEEGKSKNPMNTLIDSFPKGLDCRAVLSAFGDAHRAFPSYEQADCQEFAKNVFLSLSPGDAHHFPSDGDFM